jgi:periplasmic divalent cation tolerance protein
VTQVRLALVTAPPAAAAALVRRLVEERLAACGNIVPGITSIYRWQGEVREEVEALIVLKTTASSVAALLRRVPELHPYDVPEVLVLSIEAGYGPYVDWVAEGSRAGAEE